MQWTPVISLFFSIVYTRWYSTKTWYAKYFKWKSSVETVDAAPCVSQGLILEQIFLHGVLVSWALLPVSLMPSVSRSPEKMGGETNSGWKMDGNDEMVANQAVLNGCLQFSWHLERCMLHQRLWSLQVSDDGDIFDTVYTVQARWSVVLWKMVINLINLILWNHIDEYYICIYTHYICTCVS